MYSICCVTMETDRIKKALVDSPDNLCQLHRVLIHQLLALLIYDVMSLCFDSSAVSAADI